MSTADRIIPSPTVSASTVAPTREIAVAVSALADLFNAPTANPFVDRDLRALGEPALERAVRELQIGGLRDRWPVRLRVQAPADQLMGDTGAPQVGEAIHRYCTAKITDNEQRTRLIRRRSSRGLVIALILVLLFALLAYLLLTRVLAQAGTVVQVIVAGSVSVFAWVVLWDTLEALIFDPIPLSLENHALTRLANAEIVVDPVYPGASLT